MNFAGWTIMIVSVSSVVAACTFCYVRILKLPTQRDADESEKTLPPMNTDRHG